MSRKGPAPPTTGTPLTVAVLSGGASYERAVSLRSGQQVQHALEELGHEATIVDTDASTAARLGELAPDVVFIALHGAGGEDGAIQELLEALSIPYTGTGPGAAATTSDKAIAKRLIAQAGLPTPRFRSLSARALHDLGAAALVDRITDELGLPLVVKPAVGGSALGVRFAHEPAELPRAIMGALSYHDHVLIEQHVAGVELAVTVVGTEDPRALPAVEVTPVGDGSYDFDARYTPGATTLTCPPAELDPATLARVGETCIAAYRLLGVRGYGRVDLILDADGMPQLLEVDTVPGLTPTSLTPMALSAADMTLADLVAELLADALERSAGTR